MKKCSAVLVLMLVLSISSVVYADPVTVFVDGRSGPWNIASNSLYPYGGPANGQANSNLDPTVVSTLSGFAMTPGDTLTIQYVRGLANAGGPGIFVDANGFSGWGPSDPSNPVNPCYYIPSNQQPVYLETLIGVFANNGYIVGTPFRVGNGPISFSIPNGANQLLLGFNDGWFNDNGDGIYVGVTETPTTTPEPATMLLLGFGIVGLASVRKFRK
jgi:hypothetical protein